MVGGLSGAARRVRGRRRNRLLRVTSVQPHADVLLSYMVRSKPPDFRTSGPAQTPYAQCDDPAYRPSAA